MDKKHGQSYTCDLCGKFFGTNEALQVHNTEHHKENSSESKCEEIA